MNIHDAYHNDYCDGAHCVSKIGEVRVLPTGVDSNAILCRACYTHEMKFRRERNYVLGKDAQFQLPTWESLKVYGADQ